MIRFLHIVNARHTFVFKWDGHAGSWDTLVKCLRELAKNPEMDFDWEDADEMRARALEVEEMVKGTHG